MDFKYIRRLKPFIILSMVLIFMPTVTKAAGIVPSTFNGFTVTSDGVVIVGNNISVSGWKDGEMQFSFTIAFNTDYALSVNQNNNIVIYTENAKFVFSQDGTPLTFKENTSVNIDELKNRQVITLDDDTSYVLTTRYGIINSVIKVHEGTQTTEYKTPLSELMVEFAFWEGNLILIVSFVAVLLDVRKRRFVKPKTETDKNDEATKNIENTPKKEIELPKFLKAFTKPEVYNKGAAFSSEYSTKPGARPRFSDQNKDSENSKNEENNENENTDI